ncbi:YfhO family protein [Lactiplantibacillus fabifermentans]|uniref:Integral membrane protein n=2 Tax=Lactiplantibacillus fabifermentans TaxID=483011 RepID=A0A0R2NPL5_9LACO|nr:YfhO family protein [Lactiplantibacillus fabifermentans]ETY74425.1 membrane protein [Lactiplantibacillus fabifermentans T30PCM01]KRO26802.1 integral membrane protein [Lactiplantibacillus fabifermentans DSM 21115]
MLNSRDARRWQVPLTASIMALAVSSVVFWLAGITPFGTHNLLISDMGGQYLSFFTAYRHAFLTHNFQLYSFSQSLGGNAIPTVAYYLMSPFNLLIIAFPAAQIPTGLTIIIIVKIAAIAFTMTWFLQRHFQTNTWATALFGLAFSMSGFVALNYFTIMWLDALIWLPLVILGLDHLMATGHPAQFFWWLWVSIVTDYYLGYMTCLFVIYYFVYQLFESKAPTTRFWASVRQRRQMVTRVVVTAVLSGLSTLFLLIPTGLGMLQTAKSSEKLSNYLPLPQFSLDFLSQLGLGANNFTTRLQHAPTLFSTTLVALLVIAFFTLPKINKLQKKHAAWLLVALFLSMEIKTFNTMWHMFQRPAGFPYRQAFFVSFVLIMLAFQAWQAHPRDLSTRWRFGVPGILASLLVIGWLSNLGAAKHLSLTTLALSLAYVAVTAIILFMTTRKLRQLLLTGVIATELGGNFLISMRHSPFGNQTAYQTLYQAEDRQMAAVNDPDGQLYRVENENTLINQAYNYNTKYRNYNDPMLFNFHDTNYYSSTFDNQTRLTLKSLGLYSKNVRRVSSEGMNAVSEMLLGIKYSVHLNANGSAKTTTVASHVGMGFLTNDTFAKLKMQANSALVNQEKILQAIQPSATPYFAKATIAKDAVTYESSAKTYRYLHHVTLKVNASGHLYYDDTHGTTKYSTFRVNGQLVTPKVNADGHIVLRDLGTFKRGQTVTLTFKTTKPTLSVHQHLASLNATKFKQVYQGLQANEFVPHYQANGVKTTVTGTVNNRNHAKWLYVAIPYEKAWTVTVNGQRVTTKKVLGGLTAIPVTTGQNKVKLSYDVPGLTTGIIISGMSLLGFAGINWRRKRRRQTK